MIGTKGNAATDAAAPATSSGVPASRYFSLASKTVVTWGAMVERCELAAKSIGQSIEIIDLRTIAPWDKEAVLESVNRTRRCLIVHEDGITAGFGAEVAATVAQDAFFSMGAAIQRLAIPDVPVPHNFGLMDAVVPTVEKIAERMTEVIEA